MAPGSSLGTIRNLPSSVHTASCYDVPVAVLVVRGSPPPLVSAAFVRAEGLATGRDRRVRITIQLIRISSRDVIPTV